MQIPIQSLLSRTYLKMVKNSFSFQIELKESVRIIPLSLSILIALHMTMERGLDKAI